MKGDLICYNGRVAAWGDIAVDPDRMLGANFIYQKIHVLGQAVLQADMHIAIADASCKALYGITVGLTSEALSAEIGNLLSANKYYMGSHQVVLYLFPPDLGTSDATAGSSHRLLSCEKQLLYKGYAMWHTALNAVIIPYEYPLSPHKTALSLAVHSYANDYALRGGNEIVLTENYSGILTGAGENPLFAVAGRRIMTTPVDDGAADSVERRLCMDVCRQAGLEVYEQSIESASLADMDEMFTVTPQGIVSIRSCSGRLFPHSMAKNIASHLKKLSDGYL